MKHFLIVIFLSALLVHCFPVAAEASAAGLAEEAPLGKKKLLIHLRGGLSFANSSWSFSHYLLNKRTEASVAKGPFYEAGVEFRKSRAGWKFSIGTMPSEVTVNPDDLTIFETRVVTFHTNYFSVNRIYYLGAENSRISPFLNGGLGMIVCSGGIKNSGVMINLGTGLFVQPSGNLSFQAGLELRVPYYINFRESPTMNRTIYFFSPVVFLGASYKIK